MRDQDSFQCFFKLIQLTDSEAGKSNIYMTLHLVCFPLNFAVYQTILLCDLAADAAKSLQSCPTLCDPIDGSPPGSPIPEILQARTLEWVAISFSNAWKWKVKVKSLSHVRLLVTPRTAAYQAPPSIRFSRQEYWSGCHCLLLSRFLEYFFFFL